jgi:hypothetical protein
MRPHACPAWEGMGYHATLWAVKGNHAVLLAVDRKFESQLNGLTAFQGGSAGKGPFGQVSCFRFVPVGKSVGNPVDNDVTPGGALAPDGL